ncbi:DUF3883 domain-containing protein [Furfurilactobacillus entadae]|uniref:DUF3883 domain-containing protein n=1 Tax=Furfurilactobacillus entadae TaxID=2922307 RepID=UPI0035E64FFB
MVEAEQTRLASIPELQSKKVEHTSVELGDGAGYDIKSYRLTDNKITEHFIEVKATTGDIKTPLFMSKNEINVAKEKKDKYSIVRIFKNKDNEWSHYTINGPFSEKDKLYYEPVQYQVLPK